ncbi:hypothetical protein BpHYR1_015356 [Brachionus plicatilis]|uniref:Uncharacterized protein n=1 Tax=Brachionus plicatilis TaxID=10195 RepID=A0A3M7T591_BRAPC|nr:hypothetical protein BpHYR1_015356 [Brachionus plicatilis]
MTNNHKIVQIDKLNSKGVRHTHICLLRQFFDDQFGHVHTQIGHRNINLFNVINQFLSHQDERLIVHAERDTLFLYKNFTTSRLACGGGLLGGRLW